ncbi:RidA family protein [Candidatus Latescibacterota bacterium]
MAEKRCYPLEWATVPLSGAVSAGGFIFCSGHTGARDENGDRVDGDIGAQTRLCLENMRRTLEQAGASLSDVVKTQVFLTKPDDFDAMNEVYGEFFSEEFPARSTTVTGLVRDFMLIEIECVAYKGEDG